MIKRLGILFAGIIITVTGQAQWNLEKSPTQNQLNAISMIDMNSGWIVGDNGTILYKTDKGWKEFPKFTNEDLNSVFMVDKNDVWAAGDKGIIMHYNGMKWEFYNRPTSNDLYSVRFQDSERGIAVGDLGTILIYENGSWTLFESGIRGNLYSVFYKKGEAWLGGGLECDNVPIMKMETDKNKNSLLDPFNPHSVIKSMTFISPEDGWAVGSPSTLLHFDGQKWEKTNNNDFSSLNSVFFSNENNGISVGYGGTVLIYSENAWTKEKIMTSQNLNGAAITWNKYYAVGDSGTIISRDLNSDDNLLDDLYTNNLNKIQVYPNPCDELLNVKVPFENDNFKVLISVSDLSGKIILKNELELSNRYLNYPLITNNLKDGLYLINISIEGRTNTRKFIVRH